MHIRQRIGRALEARVASIPGIVNPSRIRKAEIPDQQLPSATILFGGEEVTKAANDADPHSFIVERRERWLVVLHVRTSDPFDEVFDELAVAIEAAVHADDTLGGLVTDLGLSGTDYSIDPQTGRSLGSGALTFTCAAHHKAGAPDV